MIEDNFSLISLIFFSRIIQEIFYMNLSKSVRVGRGGGGATFPDFINIVYLACYYLTLY